MALRVSCFNPCLNTFSNVNPMDLTVLVKVESDRGCMDGMGGKLSIRVVVDLVMYHVNISVCLRCARGKVHLWSSRRMNLFGLGRNVLVSKSLLNIDEMDQVSDTFLYSTKVFDYLINSVLK